MLLTSFLKQKLCDLCQELWLSPGNSQKDFATSLNSAINDLQKKGVYLNHILFLWAEFWVYNIMEFIFLGQVTCEDNLWQFISDWSEHIPFQDDLSLGLQTSKDIMTWWILTLFLLPLMSADRNSTILEGWVVAFQPFTFQPFTFLPFFKKKT